MTYAKIVAFQCDECDKEILTSDTSVVEARECEETEDWMHLPGGADVCGDCLDEW